MFSKALFKQSCKANGTMWTIISLATCFMLACVMLISGNGNIGEVKNSIQDTIITKEIDSQMQRRALSYYENAKDGTKKFDSLFAANASDTLAHLAWLAQMPSQSDVADPAAYAAAMSAWQSAAPQMQTAAGESYVALVSEWQSTMPAREAFANDGEYAAAMEAWQSASPATQSGAITAAYTAACEELQAYVGEKAQEAGHAADSTEAAEMLGSVMYTLNPNGMFNDFYTDNGESAPEDYDVASLLLHVASGNAAEYIASAEREAYRAQRAENGASVFLSGNMVKAENVDAMIDALSSYGVDKEKYDSFGYTYGSIKHLAKTAVVTYRGRYDYEMELLEESFQSGEISSESEYRAAVAAKAQELRAAVSQSFLSTLPAAVSEALEEIGQMDLYTLVVGSIFYKLAGLLLPIIYMIMASNNLIAGQVDSGSMAYVLSTSTKRSTVAFTQAVYLIGSLLAMFCLTSATSCICLANVSEDVALGYGDLLLLNLGAFLVLFALSGLCFFTSCVFDRSKRSMAIGGGLSIFALVAAMLGLFGSPVIPTVVRLESLNYFNYVTVISLFDVISIIDGTKAFLWKFAILAAAGAVGYAVGSLRFTKKDLPL